MKIILTLTLPAVGTVLLSHCAGTADSQTATSHVAPNSAIDNGMAPLILGGSQLHYRDLHGSYTYTFQADGHYRFAAVHQSGKPEDGRQGSYRYAITAPGKATISIDKDSALRLSFKSPLDGTGAVDGDVRSFAFTITRLDGE